MNVPIFTPKKQYLKLKEEIDKAIFAVLESGNFILGENVNNFEHEISEYLDVQYAIGVSSGTAALFVSLKSLDLKNGDLVITSPFTFFATAEEIINAGATPIFADILENDFSLNPNETEDLIKKHKNKVKAIIPIHLFGKCVDMENLIYLTKKYNIRIIEDAAQAMGAEYKIGNEYKKCGTVGDFGAFSFFPTKNLGAYGDGGLVVTNDKKLFEKANMIRSHGSRVRYHHEIIGTNSRLDEIQAAILRVKLKYLDSFNMRRRDLAKYYNEKIKEISLPIITPEIADDKTHIFHQYVIRVPKRDELSAFLTSNGIGNAIYYPMPLHFQKALVFLGYTEGDFPVTEKVSKEVIALPIFPELEKSELDYVIDKIKEFYSS